MGKQQEDIGLNEDRRKQLDSNIQNMLSSGASNEDVAKYAMDFKSTFGVKKKTSYNDGNSTSPSLPNGGITDLNSLPSGAKQPIDSEIPSVLTQQSRKPYIQEQIAKKDKSLQLSQDLYKYQNTYNKNHTPEQAKAIDNTQLIGQNNSLNPVDTKGKGIMESVSQALYMPAFNQGFSDLVVKPSAGATDFIDRTIDKAYTTITGEKTPEWLRKKGGFDSALNYYDKSYAERDKPSNIVSDVAEGVVGTLPLMASMAIGGGEANALSKAPQVISNLTKLFAVKGALNSYKDATDEGKGYLESLGKSSDGFVKGGEEGLKLEAMMLLGGAMGKGVVSKLAEKGLFKGGKATESILHALSVGTVFSGTSAGEDLLAGRDINTHEAAKQFGMGLAFELPHVISGVGAEIKDRKASNDANDAILKAGVMAKSASNINGESALRTILSLHPEQLAQIKDNITKGKDDLYAESIESGSKAYDEKNPEQKRNLYADQLILKSQGDVKLVEEKLKDNKQEIFDTIQKSTELTEGDKQDLLNKLDLLTTKEQSNEKTNEQNGKLENGQENGFKIQDERVQSEGKNDGQNEVQKEVGGKDAVTEGNIPKNNQQEYIRTDEQQQGQQKDRQYQEEPITSPKAEAGSSDSTVESGKEQKVEIKEGDKISLPPNLEGGQERNFEFKDGEWKQKIGNEYTDISKKQQEQLNTKFNEQGTTIKETKETAQPIEKPTTKEKVSSKEDTNFVEPVTPVKRTLKLNEDEEGVALMEGKDLKNTLSVRQFFSKESDNVGLPMPESKRFDDFIEENKQNTSTEEVKISEITPTQEIIDLTGIGGKLTKGEPILVKFNDGIFVLDGHHRISTEVHNKNKTVKAKVISIDSTLEDWSDKEISKITQQYKLQIAKEKLAEKRKALKDLDINLSVSADPKQKAKALYEYHSALVDVAKEYINEGIKTVEDFAKEIGEKVSKTVKDAWEEATGGEKLKESDFEQQVKPKEPKSSDEFTKLTHKSLQNEEIRNTLSNVERETGTELSDEQKEYQRTKLIEALHSGEDMIDASKEEFGDEYVSKTLAFLKDNRNTLPAENEALLYVSLENDLQRQLEYDPENVTVKKQLDLVRNESLKRFRSFAIATGFGRLRQIARFGFDVDAYANSLLTSAERGDRKKVSQAVEATPDEINQIAEERESFTITEPTVKRNKKVVRQEIDEVLRQLRKDLIKSARGGSGAMSSLPLAEQIKAVTPHVIKLSKLLAELGGMKAKEIISEIRKSIEDVAPDIKDSDIKDILTAKPTAKDNLERMKDNAKARIETLKQQIEDKKRELKITNKTKPDAELKSLLEQEKELKKIANEYLTPESLKRIDESKQKAIISKLENDIKELDKQIAEGQKKPRAERTPLENDKIAELKGVKKAKQDVLEDLDPNPKEFTKQALIDAGYGRKIKVDGEERETLDWKLLAGEEGSIDNIREKVEQSLEKSGFTQAKISRMKDAFESEYNRLRADVIEKSLNELNRRNTPNEPINSRSYSERLAELYNLGLFENQSNGYDYLINKAVGLSDASQESFFRAKELAKSLSELYKSTDINGKKMTEMQLKEAVRNVNDEFTKLMNSISWKDSNVAFKVMTVLQETMGLGQRFILGTAKQAIENPLSGYVERAYQKAGSVFDGYNPKELRKHNREMARVLFKDNSLNASLPYGEITTPFITRTRTEEWVNGLSDSQIYHAMMTTFMGRSFLESADSMHKIALTEKYFQNNVIKLLTNKTYEGRMTKQEALRFVTEKLTGQKFEEAQKSAEKIINDINESAGKKILPNNREAILRFANDITKLSLLEGTNLTEKELTASFKSAYRVAGLGLGHEANNFLSNMLSAQNERIERKLKKAVQEKQWWKASAYTGASILSKNILNPFVGGGTNWVVLTAEKAGLNPFNMIYNAMQAKGSRLDLSTEQGLREVERVMFDQLRFKTSASRYFTGAMASLITYGAIKAFQGTDDGEDKLKKLSEWLNKKENKWVAKYFNTVSPSMLIAYMYMLDDNLGGYFKNLFNVRTDTYSDANQLLDAGQTMLSSNRKVEKDKAWGQIGAVIGGKLQAPAPWRLTRDGLQIIQAIKGKPVYQADYTKPNTFASGFFQGGMLDFLGWKPQNDISEDFRELKIHNAETGKYDIYELTDKQKSEFIKYRNDFAKSPQFKLLQKEYEDYKKANKDAKMDVEKELNKILNTYAKSMFLDEKTTFDEEGKITNIKKVK